MAEISQSPEKQEFIDGVSIHLEPAPFLKRLVAAVIDVGLLSAAMYVIGIVLVLFVIGPASVLAVLNWKKSGLSQSAFAVGGIIILVVVLLALMSAYHIYFIYFEFKKGATPGKRLMGLRVVSADGRPITKAQAIYRDFVRWYVDSLFILPAVISILLTKNRQRVGDLLAGTMVVHSSVAEERERFIYVKREDYLALVSHLSPRPVPDELCREYLAFASQVLLDSSQSNPEMDPRAQAWLPRLREFLERADELGLNDFTVIRFFAEYCFQQKFQERLQKRLNASAST